ncbi:biotin synthase BioB [Pseudonocardia xishanensis]|uniref:Biotin synthase n=1 Tax=Pseudonocardia xishanensis TaxID=630995 RepID=A0ABP8RGX0_9PSEU
MFKPFEDLADRQLAGGTLDRADARMILSAPDPDVLALVAAGGRVRRAHFGDQVKVNYLVNLKSGLCPEDCGYCSQRLGSTAEILKYSWLKDDEAVRQADAGIRGGASRVCLVASGRGPSNRDVETVASVVGALKDAHPGVEVCACLGLLKDGQAERLREAGVDAYNHNLNTAESRYSEICSTHDYADRVDTVAKAKSAGLSPCSGLIVGMGESDEDLIDAVFALRDLASDSIPINFLMPFDGTPLAGTWELSPLRALRILALARFACPATEVRMAGGREMHLRSLQPLALHLANSLFLGDYLTSEGQAAKADLEMIEDAGFRVLGAQDPALAPPNVPASTTPAASLAVRQRGAGTTVAPNA